MSSGQKITLHDGRRAPWLFRLVAWPEVRALKRDPEGYFARAMADMPEPKAYPGGWWNDLSATDVYDIGYKNVGTGTVEWLNRRSID